MAFSPQELQIIQYGKQNGKSREEVEAALTRLRTGQQGTAQPTMGATETPETPSYGQQVGQAAQAGVSKIMEGMEQGVSGTSIVSPIEAGAKVGAGAIETALSPLAPLFSPVGKFLGYISDKIGSNKAVQDFANSPAGETTSRVAETVSNLSTIAGAATGVVSAPKVAANVSGVASKTASALSGITETGATGIKAATSKALNPASMMQRVARIPKAKQADFEKLAGQSVGSYLVDRGIFGNVDSISTQLFETFQKSKAAADSALERIDGTFQVKPVGSALDELFARETRVSSPGAKSRDFDRVRQLKQKHENEGLTMTEINEVKRIYERNVRVDYLKSQKPEGVARATSLDTAIREWQRTTAQKFGLKNLADINKETQLSKQLLDDLGREYAGSAGNNAVTLTDWILLSGLDPTAIGAFLVKKGSASKTVQSAIAKQLSPEPKQGIPFPIFERGGPTISSYADWIKSIEGQTKQ